MSQPAITKHIKRLEDDFRQPLFIRSPRGVSLTESGFTLLRYVRQIEDLYEQARYQIFAGKETQTGHICLGCSTTISQYFLSSVLIALKTNHPGIRIEVLEGNSDFVIQALLSQRIELGLIEAPCQRRDLRVEKFYEDEIIIVASPRIHRTALSLEELTNTPLIFREVGSGTRKCVEYALQELGLKGPLNIIQELPSTESIKRMVAGGTGIGFASKLSVVEEIRTGTLIELKIKKLKIFRPFSAILAADPNPVGPRRLILEILSQLYGKISASRLCILFSTLSELFTL